jgi:pseudouridine-5'-phosphate glycosidase
MTDKLEDEHRSIMIANDVASDIPIAGIQKEVDAVVRAIKANELIHRDISDYLLRDIVKATIQVLDGYRAEGTDADPM